MVMTMKKIDKYLHSNRLIYYDDFIIIENYEQIISIDAKKIRTSKYEIIGKNLTVKKFDGFIIEIKGNIDNISIGGNINESI